MNQKDQRIYRIFDTKRGYCRLMEGDKCVNGRIATVEGLSQAIYCDYMDIGQSKFEIISQKVISELNILFITEKMKRRHNMDGYTVCGLAIKECLDGLKRSKII